jgi:hypothetical protein
VILRARLTNLGAERVMRSEARPLSVVFFFLFSVPALPLILTSPACCPIHSVLTSHSLIMPRPTKKAQLLKSMRAKRRQKARKQELLRYLLSCSRCSVQSANNCQSFAPLEEHDHLFSESDEDSDLEDDASDSDLEDDASAPSPSAPSRNPQSSPEASRNPPSSSGAQQGPPGASRDQQGPPGASRNPQSSPGASHDQQGPGASRDQQSSTQAATLDLSSLKWKEGAGKSLLNRGVSQGGKSRSTQKRNRKNAQALQKAASESCSIVKLWQRQRLLGISLKSPEVEVEAEEDRELDIPDRQPDLLVVEDCASGVLDPKEEEELVKQTQIEDIKDASQAIDRLLRLKTEQKKVYGRELVLHSAWRRRHLMVQSFLWLEAIRGKVGGRRRERALQVARSYNRGMHTARKIVQWANSWIKDRSIPEGSAGKHRHTFSWLDDEGVLIAAREFAHNAGEREFTASESPSRSVSVLTDLCLELNSYKLAAHIGAYLAKNRYFRWPDAEGESEEEERARSQEEIARMSRRTKD